MQSSGYWRHRPRVRLTGPDICPLRTPNHRGHLPPGYCYGIRVIGLVVRATVKVRLLGQGYSIIVVSVRLKVKKVFGG